MKQQAKITPVYLGNGVWGQTFQVKSIVPMWPPLWRHPIRHFRMKRAWRRYEAFRRTPLGRKLEKLENEAFIEGRTQ